MTPKIPFTIDLKAKGVDLSVASIWSDLYHSPRFPTDLWGQKDQVWALWGKEKSNIGCGQWQGSGPASTPYLAFIAHWSNAASHPSNDTCS